MFVAFAYRFENLRPFEEAGGPEKEQTGGTRGASRELLRVTARLGE